jgi:hypothetical protein
MTRKAEVDADDRPFTADVVIEASGASLPLDRFVRQRICARAAFPNT